MAARALVNEYSGIRWVSTGVYVMNVTVSFMNEGNIGDYKASLEVQLNWTDTLAQVKTKIVNEIIAYALGGYGWTITAANILMPSVTTGT